MVEMTNPPSVLQNGPLQFAHWTVSDITARESSLETEQTRLANSKWFISQRNSLEDGLKTYPKQDFFGSSAKRTRFNSLFEKYFTGADWEKHVLRTLRLDLFILYCLQFIPTELNEIHKRGLQNVFAEEINKYFEKSDMVIPEWFATKAKSKIKANTEEAKQLRHVLDAYISPAEPPQPADTPHSTTPSQSTELSSFAGSLRAEDGTPTSGSIERPSVSLHESQEQWTDKGFAQNRFRPLNQQLLPPSTGQVLHKPNGYSILTPNTQFHSTSTSDLLPSNSHLSQQATTVEYNRDQDGNWNVPKQRFLQDPQQAAYPAGSAPHLHSAIDVRSTNAIATAAQPNSDSAPFIHFSPGDITPKALKTHKRIGDKESAPKRPRANPLPQGASNDSAGNMNSAAIWDGSAVGEQNGTFGTAQIPLFPGSGQLPLERYASGNNYSQIPNYFPEDFTQWEHVD